MVGRVFPYNPTEAEVAGIEHGLKEINKALPFPSRLRELRDNYRYKLTQQALADAIGVTKPTITGYEAGLNVPDSKVLVALANFYGVSTDYILCQTDDPSVHSDMRTAVKVTKLSKEAIEALRSIEIEELLDELLGLHQNDITKMQVVNTLLSTGGSNVNAPSFTRAVALIRAAVALAAEQQGGTAEKEPKVPPGYIAVSGEAATEYRLYEAKNTMSQLVDQVYAELLAVYVDGAAAVSD